MNGESHIIYLDHNATTPILPEVVDAMLPFLRDHFGNPSSGHALGRRARAAVDMARSQVAALLGSSDDEIVFTSGGTEANNLAIRGVCEARSEGAVLTSVIEHPATAKPCAWLAEHGRSVVRVGVDESGRALVEGFAEGLAHIPVRPRAALVTLMHSNNETGVIQPVAEVARLAKAAGALVHTDAAQSVGKVDVRVDDLGVDLLSVAGHKLYAPKGVGALYVRRGTPLRPFVLGAGHERGLRPGTENVASIVALGAACAIAARDLSIVTARLLAQRERLWSLLRASIPGLALNGHPELRLPNTLNVRFPGVIGSALLAEVPGIAATTGSACHDGSESASSVILAMGVPATEALGSVRLTLGRTTSDEDVDTAARLLVEAWSYPSDAPQVGQ